MAKGKDGDMPKKELKNPELEPGKRDTKTLQEQASEKRETHKKEHESFTDLAKRSVVKEPPQFREKIEIYRAPEKEQDKDHDKYEPNKDR